MDAYRYVATVLTGHWITRPIISNLWTETDGSLGYAQNKAALASSTASPKRPIGRWTNRPSRFSSVLRKSINNAVHRKLRPKSGRNFINLTRHQRAPSARRLTSLRRQITNNLRAERINTDAFAGMYGGQFSWHSKNGTLAKMYENYHFLINKKFRTFNAVSAMEKRGMSDQEG